ncbi:type I glyceraldehyde-3-phosphate dehydrogenase [Desulfitobacterium metallireducens]|uniref:Glyceraldehyde-3-phosphate dehydrogenase n=1 Tax=Desulfitobacterium metallireducens DSM 15288 TaxID=871968 RepID=W0E7S6_9FIRM|nr:type I glyceraldehyde-3-phosphate dehydrogenase [Desulfitobacterium metallireducens]AHF06915.1 glyceraldehyde-3-phosphate dehydrogenase [Desulfitobacterium metallireducens DSM 15288]
MAIRVGINGFGRIGRNVLRVASGRKDVEIVAVNNRTSGEILPHLLKYDSVHGVFPGKIEYTEGGFLINDHLIKVVSHTDPADIPWGDLGVDVVIEASGKFNNGPACRKHLKNGAKKVVISAPGKEEDITIVMGVNEKTYDPMIHHVISNASCTTNCLAPVAKVLNETFHIKRGFMTTVHSYTNDQKILDVSHKDFRRARAAGMNIIPTTTGAAKAVSLVLPELAGKLNGFAMRVPTPNVSVVDLVVEIEKATTKEEVNAVFRDASRGALEGILDYTELPLVSSDFNGSSVSTTVDGLSTMVMEDNLLKVLAWYDNEWGYSCRVVDLVEWVGNQL